MRGAFMAVLLCCFRRESVVKAGGALQSFNESVKTVARWKSEEEEGS